MIKLTDRQKEVFDFMVEYFLINHSMPTMNVIARHFNFKSDNAGFEHVKAICRKGFLKRTRNGERSAYEFTVDPNDNESVFMSMWVKKDHEQTVKDFADKLDRG